jgi:cell division protein FtsL
MTRNATIGLLIIAVVVVAVVGIMYYNATRKAVEINIGSYDSKISLNNAV